MFESTYDMLIKEGEIIGLQKGELMKALEIVLDSIVYMPSLNDDAIAKLVKLPEYFVAAMRSCFQNNQLVKAKRAALDLFFDLPGMAESDFEKINNMVETAWNKRIIG